MSIALDNPYRFGVVESWLGFFDGLGHKLHAARPVIAALGLQAFVYGAASDRIADPSENAPFAAALRRAGASAHGAVYAGRHSMQTVEAHLTHGLTFAGRALAPAARAAASGRVLARYWLRSQYHRRSGQDNDHGGPHGGGWQRSRERAT